ncbi:MAG: site-specific DNA-methyltransferase [Proteobacteria bacterium]|nr:site-specific DNA-methyltransferase [Pseudomonadota bacterium]
MKLIHGDCREYLFTCEPDSIDLTVTSPPYDNLRTYNNSSSWGWAEFSAVAAGLWRVTKPGGVVVWVVGDATIKGSETGSSFKQALFFKECGFNLHDTMIYEKTGFSNPSSNRYHQVFEYIFIFTKQKLRVFNPIKDRENKYTRRGGGSKRSVAGGMINGAGGQKLNEFGQRLNIWRMSHNKPQDRLHPASFPPSLPHDHIISWSNEGDTVFDPFMGSGTTGKMAKQLNRDFIGIEIDKEYFEIARQRIEGTQYNNQINRTQKAAPVI